MFQLFDGYGVRMMLPCIIIVGIQLENCVANFSPQVLQLSE
jgi:uncharacterized membrane protein YwzB